MLEDAGRSVAGRQRRLCNQLAHMFHEVKRQFQPDSLCWLSTSWGGSSIHSDPPQYHGGATFSTKWWSQAQPLIHRGQAGDRMGGLVWHFDDDLVSSTMHQPMPALHQSKGRCWRGAQMASCWSWIEDDGRGYRHRCCWTAVPGARQSILPAAVPGPGLYFRKRLHSCTATVKQRRLHQAGNGGAYGGYCFVLQLP